MNVDLLIVGAGVAGLACARRATAAGRRPIVVDKARGVGGRCATRRVEGQQVDHGLAFYHGEDAAFLAALHDAAPDDLIAGWPRRVAGSGPPCLRSAFRSGERRLAYSVGATTFPKALARGLDVRLGTRIAALEPCEGGWTARIDPEGAIHASTVVLALPATQALELIRPVASAGDELASAAYLLGTMSSVCCLTVVVGLPAGPSAPGFDICYPNESSVIQLISHDSTKRRRPRYTALVIQALPGWSREHWEDDPGAWRDAMLDAAAPIVGEHVRQPAWTTIQRWRFGRMGTATELTRPLVCDGPRGGRLGFAGESFAAGGGVQAAWLSGSQLGRRLGQEGHRR